MSKDKKDYSGRPYKVGKGKPPSEHKFKRGQSGNPNGRPPKDRSADRRPLAELLVEIASEPIMVTVHGIPREVTKREAIVLAIMNDAMAATPAQRLRAFQTLDKAGAFNLPKGEAVSNRDAIRRFIEKLAEEARVEEEDNRRYSCRDDDEGEEPIAA